MRAATIILAIAVLTACAAPTHIEGHKIRATADSTVETVTVSDGLHDRAPAWFKEYWRGYLRQAEGGYAVLALDRNGRGAFYVYCGAGPACQTLNLGGAKTFSDVHYKHEALKRCHGQVRKQYPAVKPDCAIYAIKNKIVWQGKLPWERGSETSASPAPREPASATPEPPGKLSEHSVAMTWEGYQGVLTGTVTVRQGARSGRMSVKLAENRAACEGQYWYTRGPNGRWELDCGDGLTAEGKFTGLGADKGAHGEGTDNRGRKIQYILGVAGSG